VPVLIVVDVTFLIVESVAMTSLEVPVVSSLREKYVAIGSNPNSRDALSLLPYGL
jgi:hypothetical protein